MKEKINFDSPKAFKRDGYWLVEKEKKLKKDKPNCKGSHWVDIFGKCYLCGYTILYHIKKIS
jgi:hypothetical protein